MPKNQKTEAAKIENANLQNEHPILETPYEKEKSLSALADMMGKANSAFYSGNYATALELYRRILESDLSNPMMAEARIKTMEVLDITKKKQASESLREVMDLIIEYIKNLLASDSATIYIADQDMNGKSPELITTGEWKSPVELSSESVSSFFDEILKRNDVFVAEDLHEYPLIRSQPFINREGIQSLLATPLKVGDQKVGVLFANYRAPHHFTQTELEDIKLLASQAAIAIHNAALYADLQHSNIELKAAYNETIESWTKALDLLDSKTRRISLENVSTAYSFRKLTPDYLEKTVYPYLKAIADIQNIFDELQGRNPTEILIKEISQRSPISVSLDGASDAIQQIQETIIPWKREHAKTIAQLLEQEKQVDIEIKRAEILEKRAHAQKDREEAQKLAAEVSKQNMETERTRLENEKLRLELQREKIQLTLDVLAKVAPNLNETERIECVVKLLGPVDLLIFSELEISDPH